MATQDYPWIRAWGAQLGSLFYYIDDQVALARKDKAPQSATYKDGGKWRTTADITNELTKFRLQNYAGMTFDGRAA